MWLYKLLLYIKKYKYFIRFWENYVTNNKEEMEKYGILHNKIAIELYEIKHRALGEPMNCDIERAIDRMHIDKEAE